MYIFGGHQIDKIDRQTNRMNSSCTMVVTIIFDFSLSLVSLSNHLSSRLKKTVSITSVKCVHFFVPFPLLT